VSDGDDHVTVAPEDGDGRELGDLVRSFEEASALTAPVDDVADGSRKRSRRAARAIHRCELRDLFLREATLSAQRKAGSESHERLTEALDDAPDRRKAEGRANLTPKATRGDENEPANSSATLEQQHLCDSAAERVTHDVHSFESQ
jgi:hypothetical protein